MDTNTRALKLLEQDAQGMHSRVDALSLFALQMPMVAAAIGNLPALILTGDTVDERIHGCIDAKHSSNTSR
jgi:hypothetical protein